MIFVTGAGGYIGSSLCIKLNEIGYSVTSIDTKTLTSIDPEALFAFFVREKATPDSIIIHAAASGVNSKNQLSEDVRCNVIATEKLIRAANLFDIKKFIVLGTCFEYGVTGNLVKLLDIVDPLKPIDNHSLSKVFKFHLCQALANELYLDLSYLRLFQVYGGAENQNRLFPAMKAAINSGVDFRMSTGTQIRDFIHISSVVSFIVNEINLLNSFQVLNVSSGIGTSVRDFVDYYWNKLNSNSKLIVGSLDQKQSLLSRVVGKPSTEYKRFKIDPFYLHSHL
jgi:nucleoside-diphosphate-sugar epimerase